jgi:hypothetical protein
MAGMHRHLAASSAPFDELRWVRLASKGGRCEHPAHDADGAQALFPHRHLPPQWRLTPAGCLRDSLRFPASFGYPGEGPRSPGNEAGCICGYDARIPHAARPFLREVL